MNNKTTKCMSYQLSLLFFLQWCQIRDLEDLFINKVLLSNGEYREPTGEISSLIHVGNHIPKASSRAPEFTHVFSAKSVVFCVVFCRSLFVFLSFFYWSLHCLYLLDLWILITRTLLVSSNFSYKKLVHLK